MEIRDGKVGGQPVSQYKPRLDTSSDLSAFGRASAGSLSHSARQGDAAQRPSRLPSLRNGESNLGFVRTKF